ncbi:MAG: protein BmrU [Pirellulales bacterium]|nr:protein BmrU [Pirellulales bacterium]
MANRVVVSVNPNAGSRSARERVLHLRRLLEAQGLETEIVEALDNAEFLAKKWHSQGRLRCLVSVGGDGTAAELVNRTASGLPMTLLPAGNENLLARYLGLGDSPETVCRTITDGKLIHLDAGAANGRIFLLMISCGFDADVVRRVHDSRTGHVSWRSYFKPILKSIRSYHYPRLRVYWDDQSGDAADRSRPSLEACWTFAFNLPCYGMGLRLAPRADGRDGLLDVCAFRRGSLWHGLRYAGAVWLGRHEGLADCTTRRVRRLRIESEAGVPYQLDGDPGGLLPVDVEVVPNRLTLVVPSS